MACATYGTEIARRYDKGLRPATANGVTEKLNTRGMTRSAKGKAGLNKSILSVGFRTLNQMLTYKIEQKGGLVWQIPTQGIKPSQRCPKCGAVHQDWADLSNRYHICKDSVSQPRYTGAMKQLGQKKRQKSCRQADAVG